MRFLNRAENPNTLAGLFLLILLAVFAGPTVFPQLLASTIPFADEGIPCDWLRNGENRATNQSLLGRAISQRPDPPISLSVRTSALPANTEANFSITIVVTNNTLGTVPILVTPNQLIFDPNQANSGFGVVFGTVASTIVVPNIGENIGSYPEDRIRLLGPRQICVHRVERPFGQIPNQSALTADNATITAFYRNATVGTTVAVGNRPTIYVDQGLWTGVVQSSPQRIGAAAQ